MTILPQGGWLCVAMISWQKLFGRDPNFSDLREASAAEARASTGRLKTFVDGWARPGRDDPGEFIGGQLQDKRINQQVSHGSNDAQKTIGLITLALVTGTNAGSFDTLPGWLGFLRVLVFHDVPTWVVYLCDLTTATGTAGGGYRIIRTIGHKMVRLQPVHGFAAETSAATVIQRASVLGIPVSTTHVISISVIGLGAHAARDRRRRLRGVSPLLKNGKALP